MREWVLTAPRTLVPKEIPDPIPSENEVLVRLTTGLAGGMEAHLYHRCDPSRCPLALPPRSIVGEVAAVGARVTGVQPGRRVVVAALPLACGVCEACALGHPNFCPAGAPADGSGSAFREFACVPESAVDPLPEEVPDPVAALTAPMSSALRAMRRSPPRGVDVAVIVGVGGMGMLLGLALRRETNATLVAADVAPGKLALARELFADETADLRSQDLGEAVRRLRRSGAEIVFECAGREESLAAALNAVRIGGTVNLVGAMTKAGGADHPRLPITHASRGYPGTARRGVGPAKRWSDLGSRLQAKELTVLGSRGPFPYRWEGAPEALYYLGDGRAERLITHSLPFTQAPDALALAGAPDVVWVAVRHE